MRTLLTILISFLAISAEAQTRQFITQSGKDSLVKVYNGKEFIGEYIIDRSIKSGIILTGYLQQKDPVGKYIAIYIFSNPDNIPLSNVHFVAKFGAPVLDAKFWNGATIGNPGESLNSEKTEYRLKLDELDSSTFKLMVVSKVNIITKFSGIDGVSH